MQVFRSLENALKINFSLPSFVTRSNTISNKYNAILYYGPDQMRHCNMQGREYKNHNLQFSKVIFQQTGETTIA
jgi:hypothetical protein